MKYFFAAAVLFTLLEVASAWPGIEATGAIWDDVSAKLAEALHQ